MPSPGEINLRHTANELIDAIATPAGRDFDSAWEKACLVFGRYGAKPAEETFLSASPIACAVADAWVSAETIPVDLDDLCPGLEDALNALEDATNGSPLRKVKR